MSARGISVIVPAYDCRELLARSLAAIVFDCRSTLLPWEIVVVDNDSPRPLDDPLPYRGPGAESVRFLRREGLGEAHFAPGAARNAAIEQSRWETLIFLDADCIPGPRLIALYAELTHRRRDAVFLGHRVFIDATAADAHQIAARRGLLDHCPRVNSSSNYGRAVDRRMDELVRLGHHPRPYDCLFGCNFAAHRSCLREHRFDAAFDGAWGYEDIELGYRLHRAGRQFTYVSEAFVYHQEDPRGDAYDRVAGRARNFARAVKRIPGFFEYRRTSRRAEAVPQTVCGVAAAG